GRPVHYRRGAWIIIQGDHSDEVFLLVEGHVKVTLDTATGREVVLAVDGRGDLLGTFEAMHAQIRPPPPSTVPPAPPRARARRWSWPPGPSAGPRPPTGGGSTGRPSTPRTASPSFSSTWSSGTTGAIRAASTSTSPCPNTSSPASSGCRATRRSGAWRQWDRGGWWPGAGRRSPLPPPRPSADTPSRRRGS